MTPIAPGTVFTKTAKGVLEIRNKALKLPRDLELLLNAIDGRKTVDDLLPGSGMTPVQLQHGLNTLAHDGYIKAVAHGAEPSSPASEDDDLDFTSPQAMATLNIEAASRALAATEAAQRAQAAARAAMEARLRQEAEARARLLAEARAQAEAEARAKAEVAATLAAQEREAAEDAARRAVDPNERAEAEARARAAAATAVRAEAEARVRAEAEERARALADMKSAAEEEARREAETRAQAEEQAQARAAAESRTRELLEAQVQAIQSARAHSDPTAHAAEEARARVRALEEEAERAREAARAIAEAEGRTDEVPQPVLDIAERVAQLNARVQAERRAREQANRQVAPATATDTAATTPPAASTWSALQVEPAAQRETSAPLALDIPIPPPESFSARGEAHEAPAEAAAPEEVPELPVVDLDRTIAHPVPEHVPTALERAMAQAAARAQAQTRRETDAAETPAQNEPLQVSTEPPTQPQTQASAASADTAKVEPTIAEDDEPIKERLNVDRTAHDIIAESTEARRRAEAAQLTAQAAAARRQRMEEEARRAALAARRARRRKIVWTAVVIALLTPVAVAAWLQFTPLNGYIPEAQAALAERLNQPVSISTLRYVLLPTPRIVLEDVAIGQGEPVRAARVEAHVGPFAALGGADSFDRVHAHGVSVHPEILPTIPSWTGGRSAGTLHVAQLHLSDLKLELPDVDVGTLTGEVAFAPNGTITRAVFRQPNATLELTPGADGVRFALDAADWQIPYGPGVTFNDLKLSGLVAQQVAHADFTGHVAAGDLQGAANLRWAGPIALDGEFQVQHARVQELTNELTPDFAARGTLKATGRFAMQAPEWSALTADPQFESAFTVVRGELTNVDLVRAIQSRTAGALRGGRTRFEELSGVLHVAGGHYAYRQLQLTAGALNASGNIEVAPAGQLSGRVNAALGSRGSVVARSTLLVGGTVSDPQLR